MKKAPQVLQSVAQITSGNEKKEVGVIDVPDFNEKYLVALMEGGVSNKANAAVLLNADPNQITEISLLSLEKIRAISKSPVAIAESIMTMTDLRRRERNQENKVVSDLNACFLSLVRELAIRDARLAFFVARTAPDICEALLGMTRNEVLNVANSNRLLFKCVLPTRVLCRVNNGGKFENNLHFLHYVPLMTLSCSEV